jgi:hypothetical protein
LKELEEVIKKEQKVISVTCDVCKVKYTDEMEIQEFISINHTCGYGSIFSDETEIAIDICQHCFKKIFDKDIRKIYIYY